MNIRVGFGYDVHRLEGGEHLVLGGIHIPSHKKAVGHSDADVLIHAICDALLGAAGLGDIGRHFPDTDSAYKGADSRVLLRSVAQKIAAAGFIVANVDSTIVAQAPRMTPHIAQMVANISADLGISSTTINVKATTTE